MLHAADFPPLGTGRGCDADTNTLTLGDKSDAVCQVVKNGNFTGSWQEREGGRYWDVVAVAAGAGPRRETASAAA